MQARRSFGKVNKGTFIRLLKLVLKDNKLKAALVVFFMVAATVANISSMSLIQDIIKISSEMFKENSQDFTEIINTIIKMSLLFSLNIIFGYAHLRLMVDIGQDALLLIRTVLFEHMMDLPLNYFDTNKHGDIMSRYTNDVEATRQMISQSLPQLFVSVIMIVGYFTAMLLTNYLLSVVTLVFSLSLILLTRIIAKKSRKFFNAQQKNVGALNGYVEEMIEGVKVVKVFRHEDVAIENFNKLNEELFKTAYVSTRRSGMLIPITVNLGYLGFSLVAIIGGILINNGLMAIEALVVYLLFTRNFTGPINQMGQQLNFVQMALAGSSRVFEVLDLEKEVDDGLVTLVNATYNENNKLVETTDHTSIWAWKDQDKLTLLKGDVRFKNVDFGYNSHKTVLKNISLYAKPGQKIAFVGATGAGKTTIANLINRFYEIQTGEITFDGINIKNIKKESLRNSLSVVLQDTHLFSLSVLDNIKYGKLNATEEEVINAAKLANAHDFIMKLPKGYQTVLSDDGGNLSEGQRQLIAIARALIANPPVLILDEATSSIDTYTEKLIQEGMDNLMEGRTVFVIAHRLSTIKNSKAIILLDQGEIIERGNHSQLIDLKGTYYQLYTGVFELE